VDQQSINLSDALSLKNRERAFYPLTDSDKDPLLTNFQTHLVCGVTVDTLCVCVHITNTIIFLVILILHSCIIEFQHWEANIPFL
jgi:hypothetical protein